MKHIISLFAVCLSGIAATAQVSGYSFQHHQGLYTPVENYTANYTNHIVADDEVTPAKLKLPFNFRFGGAPADSLGISENGFIWFGTARSNDFSATNPLSTQLPGTVTGIISVLGIDLHPHINTANTTTVRTALLGMAPFRFLIIEWHHTSRYASLNTGTGEDTLSFQIKLYETTDNIEIVFGHFGMNHAVHSNVETGLKGGSHTDFNNRVMTAANWSASVPGTSTAAASALNGTIHPSFGRILVWAPPASTGIPSPAETQALLVYPNPFTASLTITSKGALDGASLELCDVQGRLLKRVIDLKGNQAIIDRNGLPTGMYFIKLTTKEGKTSVQKIVVGE